MKGNIVSAARWLGTSLVLASVVLVGGLQLSRSTQLCRHTESMRPPTEGQSPPVRVQVNSTNDPSGPAKPSEQVQQLAVETENTRLGGDEWERFWYLDQPSHLTPFGIRGGTK